MTSAFIALGANLPFNGSAPVHTLALGLEALLATGLALGACSGVWESPAWPPSDQPNYVNAVAEVAAAGLEPQSLYQKLRAVETRFGRERRTRWDARILDLDIVALDGFVGSFDGLELPHPRMHERGFVLAPMSEIAPAWRHPRLGKTVQELLGAISDRSYRRLAPLTLPQA